MNRTAAGMAFAQWLGETHPEVYETLFAQAIAGGANARYKAGLGSLGDDGGYDWSALDVSPALQDIQVDTGNLDYVVGSSMSDIADALPLFDVPAGGGTSSSVVSSPSRSSGGGITGAIGSVGNWLTSTQGLNAIANLGVATLNTVVGVQAAKAQMAVVQAQAQRALNNQAPLPITYVQGANGQMVPVYVGDGTQLIPPALQAAINSGAAQQMVLPNGQYGYTLPQNTLSSLLGGNTGILLALLAGGVLLAVMAERSNT